MAKLLTAAPVDRTPPLCGFFGELEEKQRSKLLSLFAMLLQMPVALMREPYIKHFSLERYRSLYELRAKSKILIRIIFYLTEDGDVLFLVPFIKRQPRDTMQALDASLVLLARIKDGTCPIKELTKEYFKSGGMSI